jgi:hypothetical protein
MDLSTRAAAHQRGRVPRRGARVRAYYASARVTRGIESLEREIHRAGGLAHRSGENELAFVLPCEEGWVDDGLATARDAVRVLLAEVVRVWAGGPPFGAGVEILALRPIELDAALLDSPRGGGCC